jgi:intergrase/recombinase
MELFAKFMSEYGITIIGTILTGVATYLGMVAKKLYTKWVNDKTKKDVVDTVVKAVEQIYKDLHGEDKLDRAFNSAAIMLSEKGIKVSDLELELLIESALAEFNQAFQKE